MRSHVNNIKLILALALTFIMLASVLPLMASTAAAEGGETIPLYVWDGEGSTELASEAANWYQDIGGVIVNDVLPTNNSHVLYDATSVKSCTWDLEYPQFVAYSLTLATGYTGMLSQGDVDMGIGAGGFLQDNGVFSQKKNIFVDGDFIVNAGIFSPGLDGTIYANRDFKIIPSYTTLVLNLVMNGNGSHLSAGGLIRSLTNHGVLYIDTITSVSGLYNYGKLIINSGVTLDEHYYRKTGTRLAEFHNYGVVSGNGVLSIRMYDADKSIIFGNLTTSVALGNAGANVRTLTIDDDASIGPLSIKTVTLDINGHSLTANSITVGTGGAIVGDGIIINAGDFDASAGSFSFTGQYVQADDGTITLGAGQSFTDLTVNEGVTATLGSDVTVTGLPLIYGTVEKGPYSLIAASPSITATPSMDATEDALYAYSATSTQPGEWSITTNAPWLDIDGADVSGVPTNEHVGEWWLNVTISNAATGSATINQTITVANTAPEWTHVSTPETEAAYGNDYYFDLDASDEWHGLTYTLETNSPDLRVWTQGGVVEGTLRDAIPLIYVNVTADDGHGGVIHYNWTIAVHAADGGFRYEIVYEASNVDPLRVYMTFRPLDGSNDSLVREIRWNFGDGLGSYDRAPIHQYREERQYEVTCAIYDIFGGITHRSVVLTVGNPADPMGPAEQIAIWFQTTFWVLVGVLTVGLAAMFAYVHMKKTRGGVNPYLVGAIAVALAIAALYLGGLVTW